MEEIDATNPKYLQHKANTSMYLRGTFTLHVDSLHNLDPLSNHLNKFADTQRNLH